jgi:hypothetical protein
MIEEMFLQIDYNGDGGCDWDEFTTFLSITGLGSGPRGAHKKEGDDVNGEAVLNEWIADLAASDVVVRHEYMSVAGAFSDLKNLIGQIAAEGQGFTRSHWPSLLCPRSILSARIRSATLALLLLRQALILRHRNSLA